MAELTVENIEGLYNEYGSLILYRCRQLLGDEAAAWDAMHQSFIKAIKYRKSFKGDAEPRTWLYSIATRVCLDELKSQKKAELSGLEETTEPSDEEWAERSMDQRLAEQRTVARLLSYFNQKVQEIVVMRYFDELEVQDIAKRTGLSERTVARRLSQFLERSRVLLSEASS